MIDRQFLPFTFLKKVIPLLGPGRQHGRIFLLNLSPALNKLPQMIAQFVSIVTAFDSAHVLAHLPKTVAAGLQHVIIDRHVDGVFPTFGLLMHQGCSGAFRRQVAQSDDTLSVTSNLWTEIVHSNWKSVYTLSSPQTCGQKLFTATENLYTLSSPQTCGQKLFTATENLYTLSVHLKPVNRNCSQQLKICIHTRFTSNLWTEIVQSNWKSVGYNARNWEVICFQGHRSDVHWRLTGWFLLLLFHSVCVCVCVCV